MPISKVSEEKIGNTEPAHLVSLTAIRAAYAAVDHVRTSCVQQARGCNLRPLQHFRKRRLAAILLHDSEEIASAECSIASMAVTVAPLKYDELIGAIIGGEYH
jgi:hypothetical protein